MKRERNNRLHLSLFLTRDNPAWRLLNIPFAILKFPPVNISLIRLRGVLDMRMIESAAMEGAVVVTSSSKNLEEDRSPLSEEHRFDHPTCIWDGASGISYSRPSTVAASSARTEDK